MKITIICLFTLLLGSIAYAQASPEWLWVNRAGGGSGDFGYGIAAGPDGNIHQCGFFTGSVEFGGVTLSGYGAYDICVTCLDPQGNWLWAAQAGGTGQDHGYRLAVDDAGNSYVTGKFSGTATFGTQTISSLTPGYPDVFVAKLDPDGDWLWVVRAGGADSDSGYGICVSSSGVSITGTFSGSASFGSFNLTSVGEDDVFAANLDPDGNWVWACSAGGTDLDLGNAIEADSGGNLYITGYFSDTANFGSFMLESSGLKDIFAGKLDPTGNWLWVRRAGGAGHDHGYGVSPDSGGNCHVAGDFDGTADFGTISLVSHGSTDALVACLDEDGNWLWANHAGSVSIDSALDIALDGGGNSYVTGYFPTTATFGDIILSSGGAMDIFAAKTGPSGNWLWAKRAGGSSADYGKSITTDSGGNSYITGEFRNTASFDAWSVTSSGGHDIFISKLSPGGVPLDDELAPQTSSPSRLGEAYPNPFRRDGFTCITAYVAKCEVGTLTIFNLRGEALLSRNLSPGMHEVLLSGRDLPSGLYFCRLKAGAAHSVKKVVLLK